jgi:septal ring factor EnvC (AmiA/AmiB activator)
MRSGDVALRFSIVFAVAGFITIAAGIYEIDRREKSSSETVTANLTEIEQRVRTLSDQIRVLNDQHTRQINASARELQALGIQIQTLESRLNAHSGDRAHSFRRIATTRSDRSRPV